MNFSLLRTKKVLIPLAILVVLGLGTLIFSPSDAPEAPSEESLPQIRLEQVLTLRDPGVVTSTIGTVQAIRDVEIKSESSGQVVYAPVDQGFDISGGRVMLELDTRLVDAAVTRAQADVQSQQANLSKLQAGDRPEDVEILEQRLLAEQKRLDELKRGSRREEVELTSTQLANAKRVLGDRQREAETTQIKAAADIQSRWIDYTNSVSSASATLDRILSTTVTEFIYPYREPLGEACRYQLRYQVTRDLSQRCSDVLDLLDRFAELRAVISYDDVAAGNTLINGLHQGTLDELEKVRALLREILYVLNSNSSIMAQDDFRSLSGDEIAALKSTVTTAQSELERIATDINARWEQLKIQVSSSRSAVDSSETAITAAENEIARLEQELKLKSVGATDEQLAIQESQIRQLELQLQVAKQGARTEDLQIQRAALSRSRGDLQTALTNRDKASIRAPFNGTVTFYPFEEGDYISVGEVVARLADRSQLEVKTFVTEKELDLIREGTFVELQGRETLGIVTEISPALDALTKKIEVVVTLTDGLDGLVLGQMVFVDFQYDTPANTIRLPLTALHVVQDQASVLTVIEGVITPVPVTLGEIFGESVVVQGIDPSLAIIPDVAGVDVGAEVEAIYPEQSVEEPTKEQTEEEEDLTITSS